VSDRRWPCWACAREITGLTYQKFTLEQKWKDDYRREGSCTLVVLCLDCGSRVRATLTAIHDAAQQPASQEGSG